MPARATRLSAAPAPRQGRGARPDDGKPIKAFRSKAAWRTWLSRHHAASPGLWLRFARKGSGLASVAYDEALDVALCFGWIDGQARRGDERTYLQKFTPRARRSLWSKRNRVKAMALIASGEMQPAGLAEVARAQADGRWAAAYDSPATIKVPRDFMAALKREAAALKAFEALDGRNRFAMLYRIQTAKKAETRARRIAAFVQLLARGEKLL